MPLNKFTFFAFVLIPTCLVGYFYKEHATDQYISESRYLIQGNSQNSTDVLGVVTGLTGTSPSSTDSLTVQNYINSHDFLEKIQQKIDVKKHFSNVDYDWWSRLDGGASKEGLLDYWSSSVVSLYYDSSSGISSVDVTAYTPEFAKRISEEILDISVSFVNGVSNEAKQDALSFALEETTKAELEVESLRNQIAKFNESENVISVEQNAQSEQGIVAELKQKLATAEADYKSLTSYMQKSSIKARLALSKINSIKQQIKVQQLTWSKPNKGNSVVEAVQSTARLESQLQFSEQIYLNALTALKQAQIDATQQQRYLDIIVPPHLPDEALKPTKILSTFTFFLTSFMIWGIFSLLLSSIRDHKGWN